MGKGVFVWLAETRFPAHRPRIPNAWLIVIARKGQLWEVLLAWKVACHLKPRLRLTWEAAIGEAMSTGTASGKPGEFPSNIGHSRSLVLLYMIAIIALSNCICAVCMAS